MNPDDTTTRYPVCEVNRFEALRGAAIRQDCIPLKVGYELEERAMKAEAEVARHQSNLRRAIQIEAENIRLRRLLERQHDILCQHGLEEYGN
jgi:hypothetical protein